MRFTLDFKKGDLKDEELKEKATNSFLIEYMKQFKDQLDFRTEEVEVPDEKGKKIKVLRCSMEMVKVKAKREKEGKVNMEHTALISENDTRLKGDDDNGTGVR